MAKRFARVDVTNILRELENTEKAANLANEDLQIELARAGEEKMKQLIETRGTGDELWGYTVRNKNGTTRFKARPLPAKIRPRSGNLKPSGGQGRVNTGKMRDSVGVRFESGGKKVISAFGWIRNFEDYFGYQEEGFRHVQAKITVPGMFALRDARRYVVNDVLPKLVRKYENKISRGDYS